MSLYINLAADGVIWEVLGDQVVTANMETGVYCNIEEGTGSVIWHLLLSGLTAEEVAKKMGEHYGESEGKIKEDIIEFIEKLESINIWSLSSSQYVSEEKIKTDIKEYDKSKKYKKPKVIPFNDINSLIQIDPIDEDINEIITANG